MKRRVFLHCSQCTQRRKVIYHESMFESTITCKTCSAYLGRIEYVKPNPNYQWLIGPGTKPSDEAIKELGL